MEFVVFLFWWIVGAFSQSSPLHTWAFLTLKTRSSALLGRPALGWVSSGLLLLSLLNHTWLTCHHEGQTALHALIFLPAGLPCGFLAWGCSVCMLSHFSHSWLFATLWTIAHQAPLSMGFSRQESWGGLPCHPPRDLPDPEKVTGIEPVSLMSPALAGKFSMTTATWERSELPSPSPVDPLNQGSSLGLWHCRWILYHLSLHRSPVIGGKNKHGRLRPALQPQETVFLPATGKGKTLGDQHGLRLSSFV